MKRLLVPALIPILACGRSSPHAAAPSSAVVRVEALKLQSLHRVLRLPGVAEAFHQVELVSRVSGYVAELPVDRGDRVTKGQILARIHVPEMAGDLAKAQAQARLARARLERLEAAAKASAKAVAPAQLDLARAELGVAEAELKRLEDLASDAIIRTPFGGVITDRRVDAGALVQAGGKTPLLVLTQMDPLRIFADVPEADAPKVKAGLAVLLESRALPEGRLQGKVARVSGALDSATRTMKVEVDVANRGGALLPGMEVTMTLDLGTREGALMVGADAVQTGPNGPFVWVVANGRASRRAVRLGQDTGASLEILEGLRPDDRIVTWGQSLLEEGRAVDVQEVGK